MKPVRSSFWLIFPAAAGILAALAWLVGVPQLAARAGGSGAALRMPQAIPVFINEFHYDNASTDSGEGVEVAGPAGTDLSGWSLALYNGDTGAVYDTRSLSGVIPNLQNGYGMLFYAYTSNSLQNGPDGMALIDAGGAVVQFLSYEGSFTALNGPALGLVSDNLPGVEDGSDPAGTSLQLSGSGRVYADFTWGGPFTASEGGVNPGQHFTANADLTLAKTGPLMAVPGSPLRYTLVITNTALAGANDVVLTDTLPLSTTFAAQDGAYPFSSPAPGVLVWEVGAVPSDTLVTIHLTLTADSSLLPGSVLTNNLRLGSTAPADDPANNTAGWITTLRAASAAPQISKHAPLRVDPGSQFTYTINVQNDFAYALQDIVITDSLPSQAVFIRASGGGSLVGGQVRWNVTELPAYADLQVNFTVSATGQVTYIVNTNYAISAANFPQVVFGQPVTTLVSPDLRIRHIQGRGHRSLLEGSQLPGLAGIVTARRTNGFYIQDPLPDADPATSEGIFIYVGQSPVVQVGDAVTITGLVEEAYPGGADLGGLPVTRILSSNASITVWANGMPLPVPVRIGAGGRTPPSKVIEDDAAGNVEDSGVFDPVTDGIDFYESLEGMRVSLADALAVAGTDKDDEIVVVGDAGAGAGVFSQRGALVVQSDDFNPERIHIDDAIINSEPQVSAGAFFSGVITGVLDYSGGNFKLINTSALPAHAGGVVSETAPAALPGQISLAAFNLENLDPSDPPAKFSALAQQIVHHLGSPGILAVEEVQDDSGTINDDTVSAAQTFQTLITAIQAAGGPVYAYRSIDPLDNRDGGDPGGNIRTGFLFRPEQVSFVDRPGGDAITPVTVTTGAGGPQLSLSPGRIDPANPAFLQSRKPLAAEFLVNGHTVFVIVCHLNSKTGDAPLFGRLQPPPLSSEAKRIAQGLVINGFVGKILALQPSAAVVVLGDLNDHTFSPPLNALKGGYLFNLVETLPAGERYSYIFDGNAQIIDHILVSSHLFNLPDIYFDIVHVNAEFPAALRPTDHEPVLARFSLPPVVEPLQRLYLPTLFGGG